MPSVVLLSNSRLRARRSVFVLCSLTLSLSFSRSLVLRPSSSLAHLHTPGSPLPSRSSGGGSRCRGPEPLSRAESPLRCGVTSPLPRRRCLLRAGSSSRSSSSGARASGRPFESREFNVRTRIDENGNDNVYRRPRTRGRASLVWSFYVPPPWRISPLFEALSKIFISNLRILRGTSRDVTRAWNRFTETSPGLQFIKVD